MKVLNSEGTPSAMEAKGVGVLSRNTSDNSRLGQGKRSPLPHPQGRTTGAFRGGPPGVSVGRQLSSKSGMSGTLSSAGESSLIPGSPNKLGVRGLGSTHSASGTGGVLVSPSNLNTGSRESGAPEVRETLRTEKSDGLSDVMVTVPSVLSGQSKMGSVASRSRYTMATGATPSVVRGGSSFRTIGKTSVGLGLCSIDLASGTFTNVSAMRRENSIGLPSDRSRSPRTSEVSDLFRWRTTSRGMRAADFSDDDDDDDEDPQKTAVQLDMGIPSKSSASRGGAEVPRSTKGSDMTNTVSAMSETVSVAPPRNGHLSPSSKSGRGLGVPGADASKPTSSDDTRNRRATTPNPDSDAENDNSHGLIAHFRSLRAMWPYVDKESPIFTLVPRSVIDQHG